MLLLMLDLNMWMALLREYILVVNFLTLLITTSNNITWWIWGQKEVKKCLRATLHYLLKHMVAMDSYTPSSYYGLLHCT